MHADIVIVETGLAGYSAAIEAFDRGSSIDILTLEKVPEHHRRGNGRVAGQSFFVPKSREKLKCHMQALCASNPLPEAYLNDWVSDMMGLEYVYPFGTPYNTGDGLQILMKVHGHYLDTLHSAVTPIHMIFDEDTRLGGALTFGSFTWSAVIGEYDCSENAEQEIRSGIIKTVDSIPELAVLMGRPPDSVKATVDRFNRMCALGHDEDHGRDPDSMAPITPPFYTLEITPGLVCTTGGAKRNIDGAVLDHSGNFIPRLSDAGELGSMFSGLYQNGSFLSECMTSGPRAGAACQGLQPW